MNLFYFFCCLAVCASTSNAQVTFINHGPLDIVAHFSKPPYQFWSISAGTQVTIDYQDPWIIFEWENHLVHYYSPKQIVDGATYLLSLQPTPHNEFKLVFAQVP